MKGNIVITNFLWRFAERCGAQAVSLVVSIILARILVPEVYGKIALVTVFITIMQVFVDSGFGNALIQKKDADDLDFSTVFYFNVVSCLVLYLIVYVFAPRIGQFYSDKELIPIIRVLAVSLIFSGVKNVQQAYVSKNMQFKRFFFATIGGTVIAAIAGIVMAYLGYGVWALVAQQLLNIAFDTIILWITVKWRPKFIFSIKRLKELFNYGWKLLASSLIDTVYNDLRQLIIGKLYTSADLAQYNRGKQFPNLIIVNVNSSIDSVLLPTMSEAQDDVEEVKKITRKSMKLSIYIIAPLMIGLACCAETVVKIVLTDKWLPCVPFMQIFCLTYLFYPVHTANLNAIKAMGRSDYFLKLEVIKKTIGFVVLLLSMNYGVMAMAQSLLLTTFISMVINSYPNKKLLNYSFIEQIKDIIPSIAIATIMGVSVYLIQMININIYLILIIQILTGVIFYIILSILFKNDSFNYLLTLIKRLAKIK